MKHLTKIVLGSVLSVAMVLSAGLATINYKKVSAYEVPTTVQTSSIVENIETENGHATYVVNKKQVAGSSTYTGIRLAGRANAIFNLGTIDLKEASYWNGPDHAPKTGEGKYDTNYYTAAGVDYKSFISFVYDPFVDGHKNVASSGTVYKAELGWFDITLTSIADPTEYVTVRVNQGLRTDATNAIGMQAMAKNNDNRYGERNRYLDNTAKEQGVSFETASKAVDALGNQVAPIELAYDSGAVYSPTTFDAEGLRGAYCIRNFSNPKEAYVAAAQANHTQWAGFTAAADGSIKVKVEVKFVVVNTVNSKINESAIIVTSFNGYNFSDETQTLKASDYVEQLSYNLSNVGKGKAEINAPVAKHINGFSKVAIPNSYAKIYEAGNEANADTLTFTGDTATYNFDKDGEFIFDFYNDADQKIGTQTITVAETAITNETINVKATNGTASVVTEGQPRYTNVNYTGLKLTGGEYATFDLGTIDLAKSNWEGTATSITGAYDSFFDFVFAPRKGLTIKERELNQFTIRLTDVNDVNNYVDIKVWPRDSGSEWVYAINTKAVGQSQDGAFRNKSTPTLITDPFVTKNEINDTTASVLGLDGKLSMFPNGDAVRPFSLVFDVEDNALYSPVTFNSGELATSYAIRDYDEAYNVNDATWAGFSKDANGCALVNVSLTYGTLSNCEESSIIITKLGEYDFSKGNTVDENEVVAKASIKNLTYSKPNVDYTLYAPVYEHGLLTSVIPNSKAVIKYADEVVDTIEFTTNTAEYTFTNEGVYTIEFQNSNGDIIGEPISVNVVDVQGNINVKKGSHQVYDNEGNPVTNYKVGYVIKFTPAKESLTSLLYSDVRKLTIGNKTYTFNPDNPNKDIPLEWVEDGKYYKYTIDETDLVEDYILNLDLSFDRWSNVKVYDDVNSDGIKDSETPIDDKSLWSTDGVYGFPLTVFNNSATIATGNSNGTKVLMGYARTDLAEKNANNKFIVKRSDVTIDDEQFDSGLVYYQSHTISMSTGANGNKALFVPMPNMEFLTTYMEVKVDTELKLTSGYTEEYSGLRFVLKFNKVDMDNYNKYRPYKSTGNPFGEMHLYVTTVNELKAGGKLGITNDDTVEEIEKKLKNISAANFNNSGWSSTEVANHLGLYNGKNPGYVYKNIGAFADIFNEYYLDDNYYGMCITVNNLKEDNYNKQYVFMPCIAVNAIAGTSTSKLVEPKLAVPRVVAREKLNEVLKTEDFEGRNYTMVDQNGDTYYSKYTAADMNWLAGVAGDDRKFEKVA